MVMTREMKRCWSKRLAACALVCGLGAACSSDGTANIGDGELSVDKNALASYAAEWEGYVEAYTFPSGSDRVRVTLDEAGNGWLRLGDAEEPAPPTNPDVGWPEGFFVLDQHGQMIRTTWEVLEGLRYPISGAVVEQERIRLTVDTFDPFRAWCELQTSYPGQQGHDEEYGCLSVSGFSAGGAAENNVCVLLEDGEVDWTPIDCVKAHLCSGLTCACDETGCTSGDGSSVPLDAALSDDGKSLVGSIALPGRDGPYDEGGDTPRVVRLKR